MLDYRAAIEISKQLEKKEHDAKVEKAESKHAKEIEKNLWRNLPATKEFLHDVVAEIEQHQQSAEGFALSGDEAKCAIATIRAATLKKLIENYA